MKTEFKTEIDALANRDTLYLAFVNQVLSNHSALSDSRYPEFKTIKQFDEFTKDINSSLLELIDKVHHIIYYKGSPVSVRGMLERIVLRGKKAQSKPGYYKASKSDRRKGAVSDPGEFYGIAHFRWNNRAYDLDQSQLDAIKLYLGIPLAVAPAIESENSQTVSDFIVSSSLAESGIIQPWGEKKMLCNQFKVQVVSKVHNTTISFDFWGSAQDFKNKVVILEGNSLTHAFYCFLTDAECGLNSFEDFCSNMGYDSDSISAKKTHKACKKTYEQCKLLGLTDNSLYDLINELSELV